VPTVDLTGELVSDGDEQPEPTKYFRTKAAKARQAERIALLTREGYTVVRGQCGLTVFRWGEELG
jgi:hypothetical protein